MTNDTTTPAQVAVKPDLRAKITIWANPTRDEIIEWANSALRNSEIDFIDDALIEDFADGLPALQADALHAPSPEEQEPVAIIGKDYRLLWADAGSMSEIVAKHRITVGSPLYAHPAPVPAVPGDVAGLRWGNTAPLKPEDRSYLVAHLSGDLEPTGTAPGWNQLAMEIIRQDNEAKRQRATIGAQAAELARLRAHIAAQPAPDAVAEADAWRDVLAERQRQINVEGWTPDHDDCHDRSELAQAAACYALCGTPADEAVFIHGRWKDPRDLFWPWSWDRSWWKPTDRRRDLVKAGALILAEIERLDRAALSQPDSGEGSVHG